MKDNINSTYFKGIGTKGPNVISFVSGKGGTGKSIISASVGALLANCGLKVLLIDTDFFTRGLSYFLISDEPYRANVGLNDYIREKVTIENLKLIRIPEKFTRNNLYLLSASSNLKAYNPELDFDYESLKMKFQNKLIELINHAMSSWDFQYIIIDTRGGTDIITKLAAKNSDGYIVITEADKTSWDVSELLFNTIDYEPRDNKSKLTNNHLKKRLGFIINKNTLSEREIVSYLKRRFLCRNLAVIPLDIDTVRYFQNDEIPVAKDITIPFSKNILFFCENLFRPNDSWPEKSKHIFRNLKDAIKKNEEERFRNELSRKSTERFRSFVVPLMLVLISSSLLLFKLLALRISSQMESLFIIFIAYISLLLAFMLNIGSIGSFRKVLKRLLNLLRKPK